MTAQLDEESRRLLQLGGLIQSSIAQILCLKCSGTGQQDSGFLPTKALFDAQRCLLSAAGLLTELASDPASRLLEVSSQYFEARALHIIADKCIPDVLARNGDQGMPILELASVVGIEARKLSRLMRCLCSIHIFVEKSEDVFANNAISSSLVGNKPLRAYLLLFGLDLYSGSDYLPRYLCDPIKGPSYALEVTPWQDAIGTSKSRWDWLEDQVEPEDVINRHSETSGKGKYPGVFGSEYEKACKEARMNKTMARPEHGIFGLAMVGGGNTFGRAHLYDFPWASLGPATIVDVGGGVGGFCLQLSRLYPKLKFVIQDRAPALSQAKSSVWPVHNPSALDEGRVQFMIHDLFQQNPIKHADIYWLRYILHDWSDDYCVQILGAIKPSMGPRSRILVCDQVMRTTTRGNKEHATAPEPLPANWGYFTRYSHQRDLAMMTIINGIERKPSEFYNLVRQAGMRLRKFWDCRSQVGLVEIVLQDSELD